VGNTAPDHKGGFSGIAAMSLPIHHVIASGPRPVAPFSHAVEADGFVFVTGQMPTDPDAPDAPLATGIEAQTRRVIDNLKIVLAGVGLGLEHVVMARIYLTHFERDYEGLNALWPSFWEAGKLPARTTVGVTALAVGALVEIDLVARRP
jgi:reactive intermediate/imine deaminase